MSVTLNPIRNRASIWYLTITESSGKMECANNRMRLSFKSYNILHACAKKRPALDNPGPMLAGCRWGQQPTRAAKWDRETPSPKVGKLICSSVARQLDNQPGRLFTSAPETWHRCWHARQRLFCRISRYLYMHTHILLCFPTEPSPWLRKINHINTTWHNQAHSRVHIHVSAS